MGKVTRLGSMPPDDPRFSGGHEIFSLQRFRPSATNTASDPTGAMQDTSASASNNPMQPAVDAVEKLARELALAAGKLEKQARELAKAAGKMAPPH